MIGIIETKFNLNLDCVIYNNLVYLNDFQTKRKIYFIKDTKYNEIITVFHTIRTFENNKQNRYTCNCPKFKIFQKCNHIDFVKNIEKYYKK